MVKSTTNFEEKWAYRFQSVIDELCNNAIEYGSAPGQDIKVTFIHSPDNFLKIIVEDTGTGKNKMTAKELETLFNERRKPDHVFTGIRGRGLIKIVGEWSDEIKFENSKEGGIKVAITKYLKDARKKDDGLSKISEQKTNPEPIILNI
jgi:anti-sigma regulatory factor (Ser/Thr protein kinase)